MNIKEMKENGTMDYYLYLKKYINDFVNRNYPLSEEDLRSILQDDPNDNVLKRQETYSILNDAMQEVLKETADRNNEIVNGAYKGKYTKFSIQDIQKELFQMKQEMLEKLWIAQHKEEQSTVQDKNFEERTRIKQEQEKTTGERIIEEVVAQSEEMNIKAGEINELNREINQVEKNYIKAKQNEQKNTGKSMGE